MACPDKNKDLQIMKEVAKRKAAAELTTNEYLYETYIHIGELSMVIPFIENQLERIVRIDEQSWEITTKTKIL
jgi:hypothetical protein